MSMQHNLLKPIYFAYSLGTVDGKLEYSNPIKIYAQIEDVRSLVLREDVGVVPDYDRLITVPYGEKSRYLDEQSLLWVNVEPNKANTNSDYKIERVGDVIDGNFILYCNAMSTNSKPLYYERNGKIYQVKVDFDTENLQASVPFNKYVPITAVTKVWTTKPSDINSTKNMLKLTSKKQLDKCYIFTFEKVVQ